MAVDPLAHPVVRVRAAVAAREGAYAAWIHSPNSQTAKVLHQAHKTMDSRLEQLWAALTDQQRAEVQARPVRSYAHQT